MGAQGSGLSGPGFSSQTSQINNPISNIGLRNDFYSAVSVSTGRPKDKIGYNQIQQDTPNEDLSPAN